MTKRKTVGWWIKKPGLWQWSIVLLFPPKSIPPTQEWYNVRFPAAAAAWDAQGCACNSATSLSVSFASRVERMYNRIAVWPTTCVGKGHDCFQPHLSTDCFVCVLWNVRPFLPFLGKPKNVLLNMQKGERLCYTEKYSFVGWISNHLFRSNIIAYLKSKVKEWTCSFYLLKFMIAKRLQKYFGLFFENW